MERLAQITAMFDPAAIVSGPEVVDCNLSGGTETTCFSITVKSSLAQDEMGPWCPRTSRTGQRLRASGRMKALFTTPTGPS